MSGAVITANRDESPLRKAAGLDLHETKDGRTFYIAREPVHGGTNMAIGKNGSVAVLLNGAFYPHSHNPQRLLQNSAGAVFSGNVKKF